MASINQYKFFRSTQKGHTVEGILPVIEGLGIGPPQLHTNLLSKRYDEPTYMTFRVLFGQNSVLWSGTNLFNSNYDTMPHPLFINQQIDAITTEGTGGRKIVEFNRDTYSSQDYLRDSNEFTRAEMLKEFITLWEDLQKNFQWYFQSIEGIADLLKVVPERGKRVGQDVRLTFNMLEGVDHRISYLLNLYKKIAWDDLYQRWVLPDFMRFFDIQILITEFRTFHHSIVENNSNLPVYLKILNGILPTYMIECEMCEFDINSFNYSYRDKVSVADAPEMTTVNFQVKVGNVNEISSYPIFSHFILDDRRINGPGRAKEKGIMKDKNGRMTNVTRGGRGGGVIIPKQYISTKSGDLRYANFQQRAQDTFFQKDHESGTPFIESNPTNNIRNSSPNYSIDVDSVDPINPATWIGNALTFGKAYGINFVTQKIDQLKMSKIPKLGFSFNEAVATIESKSFMSVLGLIRKSIAESISGNEPPSSLLDEKIDSAFKEFLTGITQSEATDGDELEIIKLANQALSDRGTWEQIKDFSRATNLVGIGELNTPVQIEGGSQYKRYVAEATNNDRSKATDLDGETNLVDTGNFVGNQILSDATNTNPNDLKGKNYAQPNDRSGATDLDGGPTFIQPSQVIEATPSSATQKRSLDRNKLKTTPILSKATNNPIKES